MAPYPQATGHCPTSRFHVDVSWHKSQASADGTSPCFEVSGGWILPRPECQEYARNPQKMLKNAAVTKTEWGSTPIHWWHVAKNNMMLYIKAASFWEVCFWMNSTPTLGKTNLSFAYHYLHLYVDLWEGVACIDVMPLFCFNKMHW